MNPHSRPYGYVRVTTYRQTLDAQLDQLPGDLIRTRTAEGRSCAKARGQRVGRPPKLTPHQQREAIGRREQGEPVREIARSYNVHHATISRLAS
jgi:DNA invertase Pin-like site-specific DNA recombinase